MKGGNAGMGSHKHGVSGRSGKSPSFRNYMKREAEKNERKGRRKIIDPKTNIKDLFHPDKEKK